MPKKFNVSPLSQAISIALATLVLPLPNLGHAAESRSVGEVELAAVRVDADHLEKEGSAESGYRHTNANLGPLGTHKVLDTPYSINAVSSDLLRNFGADTYSEAVKYLPSAYVEGHFGLEIGPPIIRGFQGDDSAGSVRIDGLNIRADIPVPVELYEKIELLNGPASALYGPAPAAGVVNATLKRPTDESLQEVGLAYGSNGNLLGRADISGRAGVDKAFGYRVNVLSADGESYASGSKVKRNLLGLALDYRIAPDTLIEALASHYEYDFRGLPGKFAYTNATGLPAAPDPTKAGYGQTYGGTDATIELVEGHLAHDFGNWKLDGAVQKQVMTRINSDVVTNTLTDSKGDYKTTITQGGSRSDVLSNRLYLNGKAQTGTITHDLSLGTVGYLLDNYSLVTTPANNNKTLGTASLSNPSSYANPYGDYTSLGPTYHASQTRVQSITFGDGLAFNEQWSALLVANDSWIKSQSWNTNGTPKANSYYEKNGTWSYSASLIYKPLSQIALYTTYASSVEPGAVVTDTSAKNFGDTLAPFRSKSWELGIKTSVHDIDYTAALFQIQRPFAYTNADGYYETAGEQENRGIELTARGKATDHLTVFGTFTWLDPRMTSTKDKSAQGNTVVGVPRQQANLLAEYRLPGFSGVYLNGNVHFLGKRYANLENTLSVGSTTTLDLGGRYETLVGGHRITARLTVANVTDRHYWNTIYTSWNGTTGASGSAFLAEPRTVKASVNFAF